MRNTYPEPNGFGFGHTNTKFDAYTHAYSGDTDTYSRNTYTDSGDTYTYAGNTDTDPFGFALGHVWPDDHYVRERGTHHHQ